jgi:hypothetical protein
MQKTFSKKSTGLLVLPSFKSRKGGCFDILFERDGGQKATRPSEKNRVGEY